MSAPRVGSGWLRRRLVDGRAVDRIPARGRVGDPGAIRLLLQASASGGHHPVVMGAQEAHPVDVGLAAAPPRVLVVAPGQLGTSRAARQDAAAITLGHCLAHLGGGGPAMGSLHGSGVPDPAYPTVEQRVAYLFDSSAKLYECHPELAALIPPELYERGRRLATRLAQHDSPIVLLHGDLTPSNILDGGAERGLVAIDPAPCLGDAAFDALDLILWQADDLATIDARTEQLAAATGADAERLFGWCVAFAAMSALDLASHGNGPCARIEAHLELASQA